ncbi:lipid A-modifier LpxR family protein [Maribacter sp. 2210JD10-5]|uniref:lipid A-modifier LpxR family protein n=1 Tax=Maribacter sp. 2210JD10-5 TaxID=3386272 RepID=UPI0039BCD2A5
MPHKPYYFWGCLLFLFIRSANTFGQQLHDSIPLHQIELRHDNDFFLLTDRYYSSGLFVTYRKLLNRGILGKGGEQLSFSLNQEVYTPSQTQSTDPNVFDRPYAGFTGLTTSWSIAQKNQLFETRFLLGVAGLNSGAGGFQRWYHDAVAISDSPLWIEELADSFHVNLYFSYVKEWQLAPVPFGVRFALKPNLALGTRDIYAEPEAIFYFGRRNETHKTIAYDRLGSLQREIYFALRFGYRQVFYNGLIEGNLLGDNSVRVKNPKNSVYRIGLDFFHRFKKNDYKVGIRFNSQETVQAKNHQYFLLAYGLTF